VTNSKRGRERSRDIKSLRVRPTGGMGTTIESTGNQRRAEGVTNNQGRTRRSTSLAGKGKQQHQWDVCIAIKEGTEEGPGPIDKDVTSRHCRLIRGGNSRSDNQLLKLQIAPGEDTTREIIKRAKYGAKGTRRLKGGYIHPIVDNFLVALLQKECMRCGKGTLVGIGGAIVEELLQIRQTREGEDLKNQRDDQRGGGGCQADLPSEHWRVEEAPSVKFLETTIRKKQG
jgi:hypothetical protein